MKNSGYDRNKVTYSDLKDKLREELPDDCEVTVEENDSVKMLVVSRGTSHVLCERPSDIDDIKRILNV